MTQRSPRRRSFLLLMFTAVAIVATALVASTSSARQGTGLVRGNKPGEWRVWGGDAWSSRYSALDQINESNFGKLQVAWQWNAAKDGDDEYYRTTPLYANGRILTVATTHRYAYAINPEDGKALWEWKLDEGIRWQKAPRQFAGRGLAYWTDGVSERAVVITPGYHLASLDAKTGKPDPLFGKKGVVDLMDGLGYPLVPLAVDDSGPLIISEAAPARRARTGEGWDAAKKTGADGTVGIDPVNGQIANSSPAIIVGNVIVVGNSSMHGYYPLRKVNIPGFVRGFDIRPASNSGSSTSFRSPASSARKRGRTDPRSVRLAWARWIRGRRTPRTLTSASSTSRLACPPLTSTAVIARATIFIRAASSRLT